MNRRAALFLLSAVPLVRYADAFQQNRISPHDTASVNVNGKQITIAYGRPYLKGREFGKDVAPYGQVWRLGADEATKLTLPVDAKINGGPQLPAGSYSLWAIPGPDKWTMIVNKKADVWGTRYDQSLDLARFDVPAQKNAAAEEFTIALTQKGGNAVDATFTWGTQSVRITLNLA